jgi:hypothetical protein
MEEEKVVDGVEEEIVADETETVEEVAEETEE